MASSYQIPWAYRAATEPTSVSHDRETGPANDLTPTAGVRPGPPGAQEHSHGDGPLLKVVCVWYRSHNIIRHGPHTCRRTTRTALDEAIIPVVILSTRQQSTIATKWLTRTLPLKIDLLTLKSWRWFSVPQGTALGGACPWSLLENQYETHKNIDVETCRLRPVTSQCTKWWFPTAACVWTSLVQWNVWIHRLPRANVSTLSPALVGRHFSSVFILLSFMLCQCNVMTLLNNLSGTGTWPCKRHHGHCMIPPPAPAPAPALFHGCWFAFTAPGLWPVSQALGSHLLWSCPTTALPSLLLTGDAWTSQVWQCLGHHAPPCLLGRTFNLWPACQLNTLGLRVRSSTTSRSFISAISS